MQAIVIAALLTIAGAHKHAKHDKMDEVIDEICKVSGEIASEQTHFDAEHTKALYGRYAAFFADKIDCSEDPYNPKLGYNLEGVTFPECAAAKAKALTEHPEFNIQLNEFSCIERIVDESAKTAALWMEYGNTGEFKAQFKLRGAMRMTFDKDYKITSMHIVYDTYHLLASTKVNDVVDEICKVSGEIASEQTKMDANSTMALYGKYAAFFADKIDCSEDPYNPEIGYNLEGVTFPECSAAKAKALAEHPTMKVQLSEFSCIDRIVDEDARTAALWMELGNTGKFTGKFKVRGAMRMTFDKDYKITSYHTVYDSYHLMEEEKEKTSTTLAETPSSWTSTLAAMTLFGAVSFAAGVLTNRGPNKRQVLLAEDGPA